MTYSSCYDHILSLVCNDIVRVRNPESAMSDQDWFERYFVGAVWYNDPTGRQSRLDALVKLWSLRTKIQDLVVSFASSPRKTAKLIETQVRSGATPLQLLYAEETSWNGFFHMLKRVIKLQPFLVQLTHGTLIG